MHFSPLDHVTAHTSNHGLRVLLKEDHRTPIVSLHAWVNTGSLDEIASQAGICHVLEHMVFKGTAHHRAREISAWVESTGGMINAETSKEFTHYFIDVPAEGAEKGIHLLAELLSRARLQEKEWRLERPVILEEIKRRNDDPETLVWELLQQALFEGSAHARPVIGSPETVSRLTPEAISRFYQEHYTAARSLLVIVGDFHSSRLLPWIRREWKSLPAGETCRPRRLPPVRNEARGRGVRKPVQQTYLAFGFPTPPADHPDQEALDLLATVLGEGRNARLVHTLREERKLVWSIGASNVTHEGPGMFAVLAECEPAKRAAVERAVPEILRDLVRHPPSAGELDRAKNMIQTTWLQSYESFHQQAQVLGSYALENHLDRLQQYLPKLRALGSRELGEVIGRYFHQALVRATVEPL